VGMYEWDVACQVGRTLRRFNVHFVITFYPKVKSATSAHEIMYWVTDWQDTSKPTSHSSTIWLYHRAAEEGLQGMELSQGIDSDNATLRLNYSPQ
ncbi:hypothetical protein, partial [Bacillus velezensis]|uniref:hypothetical protein n=1 Tax=Bacillus velezensis TaxID=492670 RepID=UPI001ABAC527